MRRTIPNLLLTLLTLLTCSPTMAQIESGKSYRIEPVAVSGKSLMTENSSLDVSKTDKSAQVMLWTETDVPSQRWTPTVGTTTIFRNTYSRLPMVATSATAGAGVCQSSSGSARWMLEIVDETANIYRLKCNTKDLYLTMTSTEDGAVPVLAEAQEGTSQQWRFVEVDAKTTFTAEMRQQMMDAYISKTVETKGTGRKTFIGGSWGESEQIEVLLDAYETTGNEEYLQLAEEVYAWFNDNVGTLWNKLVYTDNYHWFGHDFNDDVMWQVLATVRLGLLTQKQRYITLAKRNFDVIYTRAYIPFTGLMRWAQNSGDAYGTNSCIAGPTEVAACYLGFAGCGEVYFEKARELYAAQRYVLANNMSSGKVWDCVVWDPDTKQVKSKNEWGSTYNQGTMLGAACMLYKYYGDEQYLSDARKIMLWTKNNLCDSHGIVNVCQVKDGDLAGFKGILMRYVRRFIRDCGYDSYDAWMQSNALHAYCNRSTEGVTPTAWLQKGTAENTQDDFGLSTAASAAVNVCFPDDPPLPYEEKAKEQEPEPDAVNEVRRYAGSETSDGRRVQVMDMAGRRAANPLHQGIYVVQQDGMTRKVMKNHH